MTKEETNALIERFLERELNEEELNYFSQQLKESEAFRQEVERHEQALHAATELYYPDYRQKNEALKQKWKQDIINAEKKQGRQKFYLVAAAILVMIAFAALYFYYQNQETTDNQPIYAIAVEHAIVNTDGIGSDNRARGGKNKERMDTLLADFVNAYDSKNFEEVLNIYAALDTTENAKGDILLVKGVAEFNLDDFENAEVSFNKVIEGGSLSRNAAHWYLVALYLKIEDSNAAKQALQDMESNDAEKFLKRLEK